MTEVAKGRGPCGRQLRDAVAALERAKEAAPAAETEAGRELRWRLTELLRNARMTAQDADMVEGQLDIMDQLEEEDDRDREMKLVRRQLRELVESEPPWQLDHLTSEAAARAVRKHAPTQRAKVMGYLAMRGERGATDEEMQDRLGLSGNSVRPRRRRLVQLGLVRDAGRTRETNQGMEATVWEVTELGKRLWVELRMDVDRSGEGAA